MNKKLIAVLLALTLALFALAGCGGKTTDPTTVPTSDPAASATEEPAPPPDETTFSGELLLFLGNVQGGLRAAWADLDGDGEKELVAAGLRGGDDVPEEIIFTVIANAGGTVKAGSVAVPGPLTEALYLSADGKIVALAQTDAMRYTIYTFKDGQLQQPDVLRTGDVSGVPENEWKYFFNDAAITKAEYEAKTKALGFAGFQLLFPEGFNNAPNYLEGAALLPDASKELLADVGD